MFLGGEEVADKFSGGQLVQFADFKQCAVAHNVIVASQLFYQIKARRGVDPQAFLQHNKTKALQPVNEPCPLPRKLNGDVEANGPPPFIPFFWQLNI